MKFVVLSLAAGFVTTVSIALWASYQVPCDTSLTGVWNENPEFFSWYRFLDPFAVPKDVHVDRSLTSAKMGWEISGLTEPLRRGAQEHDFLSDEEWVPNEIYEYQFGWPLPAIGGQIHTAMCSYMGGNEQLLSDTEHLYVSDGFLVLWGNASDVVFRDNDAVAIPLRPVWIGATIDILVFGIVYFITFCVAGNVRTYLRRRSGKCVRCGYALVGTRSVGCPECGWNRPEAEQETCS